MKDLFVIAGLENNDPWPLGIDPRTEKEVLSSISWQVVGGRPREDFAICKRVGATKFTCTKSGKSYEVTNAVYTQEAWGNFLKSFNQ